jgi:hypothetical protein
MTVTNIVRILARCESLLFPTTSLETRPAVESTDATVSDSVIAVLAGRRLGTRLEPFTGFASPPGRF